MGIAQSQDNIEIKVILFTCKFNMSDKVSYTFFSTVTFTRYDIYTNMITLNTYKHIILSISKLYF